ncbi:MAG: hypothetical protein JWM85_439 [Acidimicrobiaceae bacterium]|nr:hypothetical protein [Acidimicrobiaceae bacterium]
MSGAHQARLSAANLNKALKRPHGNYDHDPIQFATVHAVHGWDIDDTPPTVDIYPMGAQNTGNPANVIPAALYLASYLPTVGDAVVVLRGSGRQRSSHVVIGKAAGSASPYPLPLGGIDAIGKFVAGPGSIWGGPGVPPSYMPPTSAIPFASWSAVQNCVLSTIDGGVTMRAQNIAENMIAHAAVGVAGEIVAPSTSYTAVAFFQAGTVGRACTVGIAWYDKSGTLISTSTGSAVTDITTGPTQASVTATSPTNASRAAFVVTVDYTVAEVESHNATAVGFSPGAFAKSGDFFFRTDTPTVSNQRIYNNRAGAWVGIL